MRGEFTDFLGGRCDCGTVYVCDETGKNLGEALMDALVFACDGDWDRAMNLAAGTDYDDTTMSYDYRGHSVSVARRARTRGKLVFVRLNR